MQPAAPRGERGRGVQGPVPVGRLHECVGGACDMTILGHYSDTRGGHTSAAHFGGGFLPSANSMSR